MCHHLKVRHFTLLFAIVGFPVLQPEVAGAQSVKRENGIYYLGLHGTPAERGRQYGRALKKQIRDQVVSCREQVQKMYGEKNGERVLEHLRNSSGYLDAVERHVPHLLTEMGAMADEVGVDLTDILLVNMYDEFFNGAQALGIEPVTSPFGDKCTTLICAHRKGMANLNGQNMDWFPNLVGPPVMLHYTYPNGLKLMVYTFVGQVGGIGVSSNGLSAMCNALPAGSHLKDKGLGSAYILRGLLEQESVADAVAWLGELTHNTSYNYALADLTDACMVEVSPNNKEPIRLEISSKRDLGPIRITLRH